ncbi:MAG: DUF547 domain-containing protein [Xanthomonadales bacterium]|nr:DUF547 domain-containing protein [Xanthomonadales bacterium]
MSALVRLAMAGLAALLLAACQATAPTRPYEPMTLEEPPVYSDDAFFELVEKYTVEGGQAVDYAAWQASEADIEALDRHLAVIAAVSPDSHPEQFPTPAQARSYWINAYNALVLRAVLEYWPLDSVQDVKISFSSRVVPGKGFFYDRPVVVGGRETNLYDLEKEVLKRQKDPRLHFALNCASGSCPVLRPWEWTDEQLEAAAREFVNRPENVAVEDGRLYLSRIFKWYRKEFPADITTYLAQYAEPALAAELERAGTEDYPVEYREYDWSLNDASGS